MQADARTLPVADAQSMLGMVECIYAAASAETSWDRAVQEVGRRGGFDACLLTSVDPLDRRPFVLSVYTRQLLVSGTPGILPPNPLFTESVLRSAPGALWQDQEIMPRALLTTTDFWTDWMLPGGFASWACMIIGRRGPQVVCLEVCTREREGPIGGGARQLLSRLAPHLTRAWRLGEDIRQLRRPAATPAAAVSRAGHPASSARPTGCDLARMVRLRAEFGLTKAEARLAIALADGCSPAQAADRFDVKLTTVRSQLQQIFAKTGTSRQAELVAMLLGGGADARTASRLEKGGHGRGL